MKRKISDLLDGYQENSLELELSAPLSSQRIKELTMKKIKKNHNVRRMGVRLLVAVVVIASLTVTAFAAERIFGAGDVFRNILNLQLEEDRDKAEKYGIDVNVRETLGEDQVEIVNSMGGEFEAQSYTDQGTTVTAAAAYCDEYMLHLYLSVTAPEGTVLPDGILYTFWDMNAIDDSGPNGFRASALGGNAPYDAHFMRCDVEAMPDENPADNQKDFMVTLCAQPGEATRFSDGYTKFLSIKGIYQQVVNVNEDEDGYELIAPCECKIDLTMSHVVESAELDVKGLRYGGQKTRTWTHDSQCLSFCEDVITGKTDPETGLPIHSESYEYYVTAESLSISAMSATWECSFECEDANRSFGLDFQVVMKDGTSPMKTSIGGDMYGDGRSRGTIYFTVPINLKDIDYILIGDADVGETYKVYLE